MKTLGVALATLDREAEEPGLEVPFNRRSATSGRLNL